MVDGGLVEIRFFVREGDPCLSLRFTAPQPRMLTLVQGRGLEARSPALEAATDAKFLEAAGIDEVAAKEPRFVTSVAALARAASSAAKPEEAWLGLDAFARVMGVGGEPDSKYAALMKVFPARTLNGDLTPLRLVESRKPGNRFTREVRLNPAIRHVVFDPDFPLVKALAVHPPPTEPGAPPTERPPDPPANEEPAMPPAVHPDGQPPENPGMPARTVDAVVPGPAPRRHLALWVSGALVTTGVLLTVVCWPRGNTSSVRSSGDASHPDARPGFAPATPQSPQTTRPAGPTSSLDDDESSLPPRILIAPLRQMDLAPPFGTPIASQLRAELLAMRDEDRRVDDRSLVRAPAFDAEQLREPLDDHSAALKALEAHSAVAIIWGEAFADATPGRVGVRLRLTARVDSDIMRTSAKHPLVLSSVGELTLEKLDQVGILDALLLALAMRANEAMNFDEAARLFARVSAEGLPSVPPDSANMRAMCSYIASDGYDDFAAAIALEELGGRPAGLGLFESNALGVLANVASHRGDHEESWRYYQDAAAAVAHFAYVNPERHMNYLFGAGAAALNLGSNDWAERYFEQAGLEVETADPFSPNIAPSYLNAAQAAGRNERCVAAVSLGQRALEARLRSIPPDDGPPLPEVYSELSFHYLCAGKISEAVDACIGAHDAAGGKVGEREKEEALAADCAARILEHSGNKDEREVARSRLLTAFGDRLGQPSFRCIEGELVEPSRTSEGACPICGQGAGLTVGDLSGRLPDDLASVTSLQHIVIAEGLKEKGEGAHARLHLEAARSILENSGATDNVGYWLVLARLTALFREEGLLLQSASCAADLLAATKRMFPVGPSSYRQDAAREWHLTAWARDGWTVGNRSGWLVAGNPFMMPDEEWLRPGDWILMLCGTPVKEPSDPAARTGMAPDYCEGRPSGRTVLIRDGMMIEGTGPIQADPHGARVGLVVRGPDGNVVIPELFL